ncbi:TetR/AcrR family transcriptional regulator [Aldersonia kunmingensis]|uniref:TetR/AcrR family transcriptional regulator n=1 Tax=Aldersonia kunmingensis TaxID=408066 RepID=UPI0008346986|nr:TetR/AcrR family transcriptional regulator [Aldersonia kunmingensis]
MSTARQRAPRGSGSRLRGEILDATKDLLARTGDAHDVSIRAVSDLVGVTAPSIYRHFADKDALIDAAVADVISDLDAVMQAAVIDEVGPLHRLRAQGLAYVRFAREHPEHYRLATMECGEGVGEVDQVLGSAAFSHFLDTVTECIAAGLFAEQDPLPVAMEMWAAAHGIASLLIAKPYLPWGDPEVAADRVLKSVCAGRILGDLLGDDADPDDLMGWLVEQRRVTK